MSWIRRGALVGLVLASSAVATSPVDRPAAGAAPELVLVRGDGSVGGRWNLWRARPDGSLVRVSSGFREEQPDWAPDGSEIAYVGWSRRAPGAGVETDIFVVDADGRGRRRLTHDPAIDSDPSWSPTGKRLVFAAGSRGIVDLFVVDRSGRRRTRLTQTRRRCETNPDWSPDGRSILFVLCGSGDVYAMNATGRSERLLVRSTLGARWSPDGASIAFSRSDGIYVADASGRQERRVAAVHDATDVAWSPDGGSVAFVGDARDGCGATEARYTIFILPLAPGAEPRPRQCVPQWEWDPAWRPAGSANLR